MESDFSQSLEGDSGYVQVKTGINNFVKKLFFSVIALSLSVSTVSIVARILTSSSNILKLQHL